MFGFLLVCLFLGFFFQLLSCRHKGRFNGFQGEGLSPLMMACRTGNMNACRTLLEMAPSAKNLEKCCG